MSVDTSTGSEGGNKSVGKMVLLAVLAVLAIGAAVWSGTRAMVQRPQIVGVEQSGPTKDQIMKAEQGGGGVDVPADQQAKTQTTEAKP